jgi:hypothetical protein
MPSSGLVSQCETSRRSRNSSMPINPHWKLNSAKVTSVLIIYMFTYRLHYLLNNGRQSRSALLEGLGCAAYSRHFPVHPRVQTPHHLGIHRSCRGDTAGQQLLV